MTESLYAALLAGRSEALVFLPQRFDDAEGWRAAADRAACRAIAPGVHAEIVRQMQELPKSSAHERHLEELGRPGTTVVVTGQQAGLFGGPLYTLHKAATAIARARQVREQTGQPCVPLFWLQSEDHDYAEVARVAFARDRERVELALPDEAVPARVSLAHRSLPNEVSALLDSLERALGALPHVAEVMGLLRACYVPGTGIVGAFARLLAELWSEEGLLLLDPRTPAIAEAAVPLWRRVLRDHVEIASDLRARAALLERAGFAEQVTTRAEASLLFFHAKGVEGSRHRLVRHPAGFRTPDGEWSEAFLQQLLAAEPLRFSTSALLRPLVQDQLLPTCAYVGGPAELAYFAQLQPLYSRCSVAMPLIAPRARLRVVDSATRSLLRKLDLQPADVDRSRDELLQRVAAPHDPALDPNALRARALASLDAELAPLRNLGLPSLAENADKTRATCERALDKLAERANRALRERDEVARDRLDRAILALRPGGVPQERVYGFAALAARSGTAALTRAILDGAASLDPAVRDVQT